jgi:FHA domain
MGSPGILSQEAAVKAVELQAHRSAPTFRQRRHLNLRRHPDERPAELHPSELPVKPAAQFSVVEGRLRGSTLVVSEGFLTIGSNSNPPWNLGGDKSISRVHARIVVGHDRCTIEDLISKTGTFVNGTRTSGPFALEESDEIELGGTRLKVVRLVTPGSGWNREAGSRRVSRRFASRLLPV